MLNDIIFFEEITSEIQNGFMANCHISSNVRLVLDLIDYSDYIKSKALKVFLNFYKAFDSIEHSFIIQALQILGFGDKFINNIAMFYKGINSLVIQYPEMSQRFSVSRGVRQGCPISCFFIFGCYRTSMFKYFVQPKYSRLNNLQSRG